MITEAPKINIDLWEAVPWKRRGEEPPIGTEQYVLGTFFRTRKPFRTSATLLFVDV